MIRSIWSRQVKGGERGASGDPAINRWIADEISELLALDQLSPGAKVLDLGCGTGSIAIELGRLFPKLFFVGADPAANFYADDCPENVSLLPLKKGILPFQDAKFEASYCYGIIQYIDPKELQSYLSQMNRLLGSGSKFLIGEVPVRRGYFNAHYFRSDRPLLYRTIRLLYLNSLYKYQIHSDAFLRSASQKHGFDFEERKQDMRLPYAQNVRHLLLTKNPGKSV